MKKICVLICLCLSMLLSACGMQELNALIPSPKEAPATRDWMTYYNDILDGELPFELKTELEARKMPQTTSSIKAYFCCDWNKDGTPELFLQTIQTRYTFVIAADGSIFCADVFALGNNGELILKGRKGLTADPDINAFTVILSDSSEIFFSLNDAGEYSIIDAESKTDLMDSTSAKAEAIYRQLFKKYIPGSTVISSFTGYPVDDKQGLSSPLGRDLALVKAREKAYKAYESFCLNEEYRNLGLTFSYDTVVFKAFYDFELDGIPELIITNGSDDPARRGAYAFEYTDDGVKYIGSAPLESYYSENIRGSLLGYAGNIWTLYTKNGAKYNAKILEDGNPNLPTNIDDLMIVKGFPLTKLPYNECKDNNMLSLCFYRA